MGYAAVLTTMLDTDTYDRLKVLASQHGRSLDDEVQAILSSVARIVPDDAIPPKPENQPGLGTQIAALFSGSGFGVDDEFDQRIEVRFRQERLKSPFGSQ